MNLALPRYRNHFHPAWLLLPVPPLVAIAVNWFDDNPTEFLAFALRATLLGILVAVIVGLRFTGASGTGLRVLKELRQQLPGTLLALLAPGVFAWHEQGETRPWAVGSYGLGCLLLGANAFGSEFEQRTFAGLLAQPIPRARIYLEKLGVAGALILLATVNLGLALVPAVGFQFDGGDILEVAVVALFALGSGPLFSLLSRSTLAGVVFTATAPVVVFLASMLAAQIVHRVSGSEETMPQEWVDRLLLYGAPVYLLATTVLSWMTFSRLQIRSGGGRTDHSLHPLSLPVDGLFRRLLPARNSLTALLRKELRLHVVPWLVAGIMVGLTLLGWLLRAWAEPGSTLADGLNDVPTLTIFAALLGTLALVVAGAASVAEERELGTFEWQLTQPATLRRQWLVKLAVATAVALVFGALLPAGLIWLSFDGAALHKAFGELPPLVFTAYAVFFSLLFVVSVYASSISRSTMKATAATVFIAGGLGTWLFLFTLSSVAWMERGTIRQTETWPTQINPPAWAPSPELFHTLAILALVVDGLGLALPLLAFAGRNARRLSVPTASVTRQLAGTAIGLTLVLAVEIVILSQLVLLRTQADRTKWQSDLKDQAILLIRDAQSKGQFTPDVAIRLSAGPNDSPEAIVANLIGREGYDGLTSISSRLRPASASPPGTAGTFQISPELALRYGLLPTKANTNSPSAEAGTNPPAAAPTYQMSPELRKRYGLPPQDRVPAQ